MSIIQLHESRRVSRRWLADFVEAVWGIKLQPFQLDDLEQLVAGGIYALMYPTDHGKSMLLEMAAVCRLAYNANRRIIIVKINDQAAREVCEELARRLLMASWVVEEDGVLRVAGDFAEGVFKPETGRFDDRLYPDLDPKGVRWLASGQPYGIGDGFDIAGIKYHERNVNRSVHCYGLGARDLQGKRGDTLIDDIEREEEAVSEAYRRQLEMRMDAVLRTLEDRPDMLWAAFGTPQHEESIYYHLVEKLHDLPVPHREIWRPIRNEDGSLLWPERARKVEIHRRSMPKRTWQASYELRPQQSKRLSQEEVEELVKDRSLPWIANEKEMYSYLLTWALNQRPPHKDAPRWRAEVLERLQDLAFYINWDPATTGDWAVATIAVWGRRVYLLRARLDTGDTWQQVLAIKDDYQDFPSAIVIVEKNGQQKTFKDVAEEDPLLRYASIESHGTFANKGSDIIGIPALIKDIREGFFKIPWQDEERADSAFGDFTYELTHWGPSAHPHLLPAVWFGWAFHKRHEVVSASRAATERAAAEREVAAVKIDWKPSSRAIIRLPDSALRKRTREAWSRRGKR